MNTVAFSGNSVGVKVLRLYLSQQNCPQSSGKRARTETKCWNLTLRSIPWPKFWVCCFIVTSQSKLFIASSSLERLKTINPECPWYFAHKSLERINAKRNSRGQGWGKTGRRQVNEIPLNVPMELLVMRWRAYFVLEILAARAPFCGGVQGLGVKKVYGKCSSWQ